MWVAIATKNKEQLVARKKAEVRSQRMPVSEAVRFMISNRSRQAHLRIIALVLDTVRFEPRTHTCLQLAFGTLCRKYQKFMPPNINLRDGHSFRRELVTLAHMQVNQRERKWLDELVERTIMPERSREQYYQAVAEQAKLREKRQSYF